MHIEELSLVAVGALVLVVGIAMVAGRIGIAAPLILVLVGIGIGYIPGVPLIEIDPEIILLAVLPPILYAAAVNTPVIDLRRNVGPISALSVVLVLISALVIGWLLHLVVPAIPFPAAVALGAVVAPTDAVAATSIGKRVGMPPRLVTILEGESLVNDATSLVLLRTAIAATAGSFVFWEAAGQFAFAVVVAIIVGLLVGIVTVWVRSKIKSPIYDTVVSFAVPFISFVPTEYLGASGVLAVVVTGLYSGHHAARKFSATARINERLNWRTLQFLLENGVFLLMGLELHKLVEDVEDSDLHLSHTLLLALCVAGLLIVLRMLFMGPVTWSLARALPRYEARAAGMKRFATRVRDKQNGDEPDTDSHALRLQRLERMERRTAADAAHAREQGLDWRGATILGWSGMRGVVTLAAAQSIPTTVPFRSQLVLIAFGVAVITLLLHGLTLPPLIRKLRPAGPSKDDRSEELISLYTELVESGKVALEAAVVQEREAAEEDPEVEPPSETVVGRVRSSIHSSVASLAFALPPGAIEERGHQSDAIAYLRLSRAVLEAQRATLLEERAIGQFSSAALRAAESALDAHELRFTPPG
ncbi:MAG: sodium:proton antiporter [Candidatus Leucobacter sulfamidivorax]|nr:sodium:proton antiporter [Candidatus Leucobacter sulfamidivorax]